MGESDKGQRIYDELVAAYDHEIWASVVRHLINYLNKHDAIKDLEWAKCCVANSQVFNDLTSKLMFARNDDQSVDFAENVFDTLLGEHIHES